MERRLTIGELARRTGVPVKTLRFYTDEGLLPSVTRSRSGYRLYGEAHVARVELVRVLREAGLGLSEIRGLVRRDTSLEDVLRLHLHAVEAHVAGLQRVMAALRFALAQGTTEENLRRISMVSRATNEQRRKVVEAFYERVAEGLPVERGWLARMVDATAPALPEQPTPAQLDAWLELDALLSDPTFLASKRANASDLFAPRGDADAFLAAQIEALGATSEARARGTAPGSSEGEAIVARFASAVARATGAGAVEAARAHLRAKYDPRGPRQWELAAVLRGEEAPGSFDDWRWLGEALHHHVPAPAA